MKKNVIRVAQAALVLAVAFSACKKDELSNRESEAIRLANSHPDSLKKVIDYTVNLVDASTAIIGKTSADFTGAVITASQNGAKATRTAGSDGIVVFSGMQKGSVTVNVTMSGYSTVDYVLDLSTNSNVGYAGSLVPMIPVTGDALATISGTVYFEEDLTNDSKETADGVTVRAIPDIAGSALGNANANNFNTFAYDGLAMNATTDANGMYSIDVPAAANTIQYMVTVDNFEATQSIVMETVNGVDVTGVQSIATVFGSGISDSNVPSVPGAYVTIGAPDFSITTAAVVEAVIDNPNGIASAIVTNNGSGYSIPSSSFSMDVNADDNAASDTDANAEFQVDNNTGRITYATMNNEGEGYTAANNFTVAFEQDAFDGEVPTGAVAGGVQFSVIINQNGNFVMEPEAADGTQLFTVKVDGETIAASDVDFTYGNVGGFWGITSLQLDNPGDYSYADGDEVTITLNTAGKTAATFATELTTGFVSAFNFTTVGKGYNPNDSYDILITGGGGSGATGTAWTDADGNMYAGTVNNQGTGYTSAPSASVIVDAAGSGTQATADVNVNADGTIGSVSMDNNGSGYSNAPSVSILSHLTTGSGATGQAILSGNTVGSIVVTAVGSGYKDDANNKIASPAATFESVEVTTGSVVIRNIDLGSGERSILN